MGAAAFVTGLVGTFGQGLLDKERKLGQEKVNQAKADMDNFKAIMKKADLSTPDGIAMYKRALEGFRTASKVTGHVGPRQALGRGSKKAAASPVDDAVGRITAMLDQYGQSLASKVQDGQSATQPAQPSPQVGTQPSPATPTGHPTSISALSIGPVPKGVGTAVGGAAAGGVPPVSPVPRIGGGPFKTPEGDEHARFEAKKREADELGLKGPDRVNYIAGRALERTADPTRLAQMGLWQNPQTGVIEPAPPEMQSPEFKLMQQQRSDLNILRESQAELNQARAELERSKNDPKSAAYKLALEKVRAEEARNAQAAARLGLSERRQELSEEQQKFRETGPTTTARTKAQQADVVIDQGNQLIEWIDQHPEAFGVGISQLSAAVQSQDPLVSEAATKLITFAALQPALHGSRGIGMQKEFEAAVGKLWSDPTAIKARIRALMKTGESFKKAGEWKKTEGTLPATIREVPGTRGRVKTAEEYKAKLGIK